MFHEQHRVAGPCPDHGLDVILGGLQGKHGATLQHAQPSEAAAARAPGGGRGKLVKEWVKHW
jgi:hypothetical protein